MPAWIINLLVKTALIIGPELIKKAFPGLPGEVWAIIEDILKHLQQAEDKVAAARKLQGAVRECTGTACETGIKRS